MFVNLFVFYFYLLLLVAFPLAPGLVTTDMRQSYTP